ncbi:putative chromatin remodeler Bromodomain family [Helianthus annuus]|uniref:Chromatin remodeler Bromodomain family n=1 Tax=Helianthus annuus TaxID=4232 RepID=A0A9K3EKP1_HELAN|nr:putative chromatin remodeler Bromodomain family [Helianthus annuus]KAJ0806852.1 putative chromatin remodeler Bromodomain family [Helianthus annuus]KAJ0850560.1 putative chromatin remodeler Bromodomain family [Helianthus annuus]KAJ0859617.1 putative chromatin remodeler Bromodomain family [Helianthus annuus]
MQLLALLRDTRMKTGQYGWGWHSENKSTFTDKPILLDLGLTKLNLSKNMYSSPLDFASDVPLVFENAMLYNLKTNEVHGMAHQLLSYFEMLFRPIQAKLPTNQRTPERSKKPKFSDPVVPVLNKQNHSTTSKPIVPPVVQPPMRTPSPMQAAEPEPEQIKPSSTATRGTVPKLPKPRAKDPNKRDMNMEEKQKLGLWLQRMPPEKMP